MRYIDTEILYTKLENWGNAEELWKNSTLKEDFRSSFHEKCWYSEVSLVMNDLHIDHFRPKAKVKQYLNYNYNGAIKDVGYYWLKNDVRNYRASCSYSNRKTGDGGKANYFPLKDGSPLLSNGGTEVEEVMLLDPLVSEDVRLLSYFKGEIQCSTTNEYDIHRVKVTKEIYNLINPGYKRAVITTWTNVEKIIFRYNEHQINREACLEELEDAISRQTIFSACAIACVNSLAPDEIKAVLDLEL